MKKLTPALVLLFTAAFNSYATAQSSDRNLTNNLGPYVGGSVAAFGARPTNVLLLENTSAAKNSFGFKLYSGYQFDQNFGAEIGFLRSGNLKRSFVVNGTSVEQNGKASTLYLAATARIPLSEQFSLVGKFGIARGKFSGTNALPASATIVGSKTSAIVGAGAEYKFSSAISSTLDFDYLPKTSQRLKSTAISAGVKVAF
jgi:OmpA-OmpF porin, OOP family